MADQESDEKQIDMQWHHMSLDLFGGGTSVPFLNPEISPDSDLMWTIKTANGNEIYITKCNDGETGISLVVPTGVYDLLYGSDNTLLGVWFDPRDIMMTYIDTIGAERPSEWMNKVAQQIGESADMEIEVAPYDRQVFVDYDIDSEDGITPIGLSETGNTQSAHILDTHTDIQVKYEQTYEYVYIAVMYPNEVAIEAKFRRTIDPIQSFFTRPTTDAAISHLHSIIMNIED